MFYILEAGARIHTPLDRLLDNRDVQSVSATAPVRPVAEQESGNPNAPGSGSARKREILAQTYAEAELPPERHRVRYAHEIMTSPVITAGSDQPLSAIWQLFASHRIHHLPLTDRQRRVQGIVSDRDITRFAANAGRMMPNTPIAELMTHRVVTAVRDAEVRDLAEALVSLRIGAIPITDAEGVAEGIVSRTDILKTLVSRAPLELWT